MLEEGMEALPKQIVWRHLGNHRVSYDYVDLMKYTLYKSYYKPLGKYVISPKVSYF